MPKLNVNDIVSKKSRGEKITMLTCYDYSFAVILDEAGVDILLVGDSLANVVLGMKDTNKISFSEMLSHTKAVSAGVKSSLVVADMPYVSYQRNPARSLDYAKRFIRAGADAVKVEWFDKCRYVANKLIKNKIPVMGHIGLTPQTVDLLGGFKVQGRDKEAAARLIEQAKLLQDCGIFSLVLECVPLELAKKITEQIKIPTIGIGAGKYCDGQVLVSYDLFGLYKRIRPKFVRAYCDLSQDIKNGILQFTKDVKGGLFPGDAESFT